MASTEELLEYPMVDRDPLPCWTFGSITLLGDAAHPMYPVGSNGGSQTIIDARVLAETFTDHEDAAAALADYDRRRRKDANAIAVANRSIPVDAILRVVAERAPNGFERITDVLTAEELAILGGSYQRTSRQ